MNVSAALPTNLWSIILAGGEGERTKSFIKRWLGYHQPKQYCTFVGTRSMFQHTLDRADRLTPPSRRVTVIAERHREQMITQLKGRPSGKVILQPGNRGTAAGIYLPLTYVRSRDPNATVVIYPSDHFFYPEDGFLEVVADAVAALADSGDRLILLGVPPEGYESDYGWIVPGKRRLRKTGRPLRDVASFMEKPAAAEMTTAVRAGGLWNTLILIGRVHTLWTLGRACLPKTMSLFTGLGQVIDGPKEDEILQRIYSLMPVRNFSSDILQRVPRQLAVMEMEGLQWSDWGRPERIARSLTGIGKRPAFPLEHLADKPGTIDEPARAESRCRRVQQGGSSEVSL